MSVFHLIYHSVANVELGARGLHELLQKARAFNHSEAITGILLHGDGQYLQVLEGDRRAVEALYTSICRDGRHYNVKTLTQGETAGRVFPVWSMAFLEAAPAEFQRLLGYVSPQRPGGPVSRSSGPGLLALLQEFAMAKIVQF